MAVLSAILIIAVTSPIPQGVYSDAGWQIKALEQYLAGVSPTANHLTMADPHELGGDKTSWIVWWPPSTQLLVYPLVVWGGLSIGTAIRVLAASCLLVGAVGWIRWFALFAMPVWMELALAILFPAIRYASNALFLFSQEILAYAFIPWMLLATYALVCHVTEKEPRLLRALSVGVGLGLLYLVKYSAVFVSIGCLFYLAIVSLRVVSTRRVRVVAVPIVGFLVVVITVAVTNVALGGSANLATASLHPNLRWQTLLFATANPGLALDDAGSPLRYALLNPNHGIAPREIFVGIAGLPIGMIVLWLMSKVHREGPGLLAATVFWSGLGLLLVTWSLTAGVSYEHRHLAGAGFTALPLALHEGTRRWKKRPRSAVGFMLLGAVMIFVMAPLIYGAGSIILKTYRTAGYRTASTGLYNPLLATSDAAQVQQTVLRGFNAQSDLWYVTDPITALDIPGRSIIVHADFEDPSALKRRFSTRRPMRIRALLPAHFEQNGKGELIRQSFAEAHDWHATVVSQSPVVLWTARIN